MSEAQPDEPLASQPEAGLIERSASAEARFRGLVEVAPEAIVTVDHSGSIVLVNGQAEDLFGYSREELLGRPVEILLPDSLRSIHTVHRAEYLSAPRIRPMGVGLELRARHKSGREFPVEISLGPVEVDGALMVMSAIRDITERKRAHDALLTAQREAEAANRAKSEFLSRMSHELRTPLNAILGFGQLLAMDPLDDQQRESVDHILRAGRHLLDLINEVLDISRIEAGRLSLSPEPVPLDELLLETEDLVRPIALVAGVSVSQTPRPPGQHVLADRQRLRQVLLNLLDNAIKYNVGGGRVQIDVSGAPNSTVRISIIDSGPGIDPAVQSRLFTPFDRLGAESSGVEGTGLGLALSRRLIEAMNGTIGVTSSPGRGSTFWFELPAAVSALAQAALDSVPDLHSGPGPEAGLKTVLYIEDNVDSYRLIERIFARWPSVRLLAAMQGSLGLELARQHRPDLVLLDIHLPDISGLEVLQRLRSDPATRAMPVVVTSADATPGQIERLRAAGADGYITKPLDIPLFADTVRRFLE